MCSVGLEQLAPLNVRADGRLQAVEAVEASG